MVIEVVPASAARFDDVAALVGPGTPGAQACWCLAYRIRSAERAALGADGQEALVRSLCERDLAPGVLAYDDGLAVGWAGVAPRSELYGFRRGSRIPWLDDVPAWSVWCFRVRGGHRGRGVGSALLDGAVEFARDHGAPVVEGYPVDNAGARVDSVLAFVGTRSMFERAGFVKVADTAAVAARLPRVLMRRARA